MCQNSFPISSPLIFPYVALIGMLESVLSKLDYFDLIKIFPLMFVIGMRNGSVGWPKVLTHLTLVSQLMVMKQDVFVR